MRGIFQGEASWVCKLLVSQCGRVADKNVTDHIQSQETYSLQCRGAFLTSFCLKNVKEGDLVHVASKLIQRPKYVPIHESYFNETELLVTDSFGSISKVRSLF
ncbi:hypothetical protein AGDE_01976 [Angomonas deanei]|uniref:Uncharacterized protein n=1 Tax=Angomonas deanei TaxID=59799 RepID=S9VGJ7_9TRYP|nr:hypothetical protein AGDE_04946 [Angomonas deanei]EPY41158.1 hypothetical protein AGDE_02767 [Angomonas deanei]EPY41947.1 hypothetical protein AGDE_01976 [Angomonas deanei]CAD2213333.1 hypothetical protein, conserved [Angomonas deanei]|eukprot:EPY38983.1 hypothetical protein AGDE_04946 [Angomonas deanei]